jgi:hypothetical protein
MAGKDDGKGARKPKTAEELMQELSIQANKARLGAIAEKAKRERAIRKLSAALPAAPDKPWKQSGPVSPPTDPQEQPSEAPSGPNDLSKVPRLPKDKQWWRAPKKSGE